MNKITKKERAAIQRVADDAIRLDDADLASNFDFVIDLLITRFDISKERAETHAAKAARRKRHPTKGQLNIRVTKITRAQVDEIAKDYEMTIGDVVVLAIERLYQSLEKGYDVSFMSGSCQDT